MSSTLVISIGYIKVIECSFVVRLPCHSSLQRPHARFDAVKSQAGEPAANHPDSIILVHEVHFFVKLVYMDADFRCLCMPDSIVDQFLHNPVNGDRYLGGNLAMAVVVAHDGDAAMVV